MLCAVLYRGLHKAACPAAPAEADQAAVRWRRQLVERQGGDCRGCIPKVCISCRLLLDCACRCAVGATGLLLPLPPGLVVVEMGSAQPLQPALHGYACSLSCTLCRAPSVAICIGKPPPCSTKQVRPEILSRQHATVMTEAAGIPCQGLYSR